MENIPDIYTDSISIFISDWGLTLDLRSSKPPVPTLVPSSEPVTMLPEAKALVRMSHAHAKAFSIILKRQLKAYEAQAGAIQVPGLVATNLHITPEEW